MDTAHRGIPGVGHWRWVLVFLVWGVAYWSVLLVLVATSQDRLLPALTLIGAGGLAVTVLVGLGWSTARPPVAGWLVALVTVAGAVVGVLTAGLPGPAAGDAWATLGAAAGQESVHLLVPLAVYAAGPAPERRAGAVVGASSGAGAGILAGLVVGDAAAWPAVDPTGLTAGMLVQAVVLPGWQVAWTGLLGLALWQIRPAERLRGAVGLAGAFVLVVLLDAAGDSWGPEVRTGLVLAGLALLVTLVARLPDHDATVEA